jgi:hypothetical protein
MLLRYSETPVIVYSPIGGERFARRLMKPIDFNTIALLENSGWNFDHIMRLCVQTINGVPNAEFAAGPTPRQAPVYKTFKRVAATLKWLNDKGYLTVGLSGEKKDKSEFGIDLAVRNTPQAQQFFKDLNLDPEAPSYSIINAVAGGGGRVLAVVTRPVIGTKYYVSKILKFQSMILTKKLSPSPLMKTANRLTGTR